MQLTSGITSKVVRYFINVSLFAPVNALISMVGATTEHIGNNIFGDQSFDGEKFRFSILNGLLQSFLPGSSNVVSSALSHVGNYILDPSTSVPEKWKVYFSFHFFPNSLFSKSIIKFSTRLLVSKPTAFNFCMSALRVCAH